VFPSSHYPVSHKLPPAVKGLLLANIVVFILARLSGSTSFAEILGLTVPSVFSQFQFFQFATYLFVHGNWIHLIFNMLILYIFGSELERYWGTPYFLRYYFISGIGAGICSIPFMWGIHAPLVGASGALFATACRLRAALPGSSYHSAVILYSSGSDESQADGPDIYRS